MQLRHCVTDKPKNPQFVLLLDKLPGREAYQDHSCSCGDHCRMGVPCRHYWAVLAASSAATFHPGLINDLRFKKSQAFGQKELKLYAYDDASGTDRMPFVYERQAYPTEPECFDTTYLKELTVALSKKRLWGTLLGEAKKAIEASIVTGQHEGLIAALKGFSAGLPEDCEGGVQIGAHDVQNPDVVKGKGRPVGSTAARTAAKRMKKPPPAPREKVVLGDRDLNVEPAETGTTVPYASGQGRSELPGEEKDGAPPPAAKRAARKCGTCWRKLQKLEFNHDSRNCPLNLGAAP